MPKRRSKAGSKAGIKVGSKVASRPSTRRTRRKRAKKDPNAPKRPITAFFCFSKEQRPTVKKEMPQLKVTEVAKELGKRWRALNSSEKSKYNALVEKDRTRYEKESEIYKKNGKLSSTSALSAKSKSKMRKSKSRSKMEDD